VFQGFDHSIFTPDHFLNLAHTEPLVRDSVTHLVERFPDATGLDTLLFRQIVIIVQIVYRLDLSIDLPKHCFPGVVIEGNRFLQDAINLAATNSAHDGESHESEHYVTHDNLLKTSFNSLMTQLWNKFDTTVES
jgi:hypothetical protein